MSHASDSLGWRAKALAEWRRRLGSETQFAVQFQKEEGSLLECPKCKENSVIRVVDIGQTCDCWNCGKMLLMGVVREKVIADAQRKKKGE